MVVWVWDTVGPGRPSEKKKKARPRFGTTLVRGLLASRWVDLPEEPTEPDYVLPFFVDAARDRDRRV